MRRPLVLCRCDGPGAPFGGGLVGIQLVKIGRLRAANGSFFDQFRPGADQHTCAAWSRGWS